MPKLTPSSGLSHFSPELTVADALSDPIVKAVMQADGVDEQQLRAMLAEITCTINARTKPAVAARLADNDTAAAKVVMRLRSHAMSVKQAFCVARVWGRRNV